MVGRTECGHGLAHDKEAAELGNECDGLVPCARFGHKPSASYESNQREVDRTEGSGPSVLKAQFVSPGPNLQVRHAGRLDFSGRFNPSGGHVKIPPVGSRGT